MSDDTGSDEIGLTRVECLGIRAYDLKPSDRSFWNQELREFPGPLRTPHGGACHQESFGMVHVKPGCRCPRRKR